MFDFVAIDFETANKKHDPCQIGIACVCNGKIADTINSYINPERQFDEICSKIHGISSEDVSEAPTFAEIYPQIFPLLRHYPLVAHGAQFDRSVVIKACQARNLPIPKMTFYCTRILLSYNFPDLESYKLDRLCQSFDIPLVAHHNALDDAIACAQLFSLLQTDSNTAIFPLPPPDTQMHHLGNPFINASYGQSPSAPSMPTFDSSTDADNHCYIEPDIEYDKFDGLISGKKFVITGDIAECDRKTITERIVQAGGKVVTAVSKKTDYLAVGMLDEAKVGDKRSGKSTKIKHAESLKDDGIGIRIIKLYDVFSVLNAK